jgi:hypothetical protein
VIDLIGADGVRALTAFSAVTAKPELPAGIPLNVMRSAGA